MSASDSTKDSLRSMMEQAKEQYLAKHADLVTAYKAEHPSATTMEILQHIEANTEHPVDGGGLSLNCLFLLFVGLMLIVAVRIQYNIALEQWFISSLFSSLNPSIDIDLLIIDLPITATSNQCSLQSVFSVNQKTLKLIESVEEHCEFRASSIDRKLLWLYEYQSRSLRQHSTNLTVLARWVFAQRFQLGLLTLFCISLVK